jgi:carbon-monoxide dehydrogenase medium subunit
VLSAGTGTGYAEHRQNAGAFAEAAAVVTVNIVDSVVTAAAIGLVNAGPCPVRARAAEQALIGTTLSDAAIIAAAEAAAHVDANMTLFAEAERRNRRRALQVVTRRALSQVRPPTGTSR